MNLENFSIHRLAAGQWEPRYNGSPIEPPFGTLAQATLICLSYYSEQSGPPADFEGTRLWWLDILGRLSAGTIKIHDEIQAD